MTALGLSSGPRGSRWTSLVARRRPPRLAEILKQKSGVFLFEFHWLKSSGDKGHHVIVINCDLRLVFCNTIGVLPFSLSDADNGKWNVRESLKTHTTVAKVFRIVNVIRVWRILSV